MNEVGEEKPGKDDEEREPPADSAADVPAVPDDEMEEITMDDEEEAVHCSPCKEPGQPTKREIEEHAVTHLPFRMWCPFCVQGKSKDDPHRKVEQEVKEAGMPIVSFDYMYLGKRGER